MAMHDVNVDIQIACNADPYHVMQRAEQIIDGQLVGIGGIRGLKRPAAVAMLRKVAARASAMATDLEDLDNYLAARRQADGSIKLMAAHGEVWRMRDAVAAALRDQLDVALHVPAPDKPTDPPSKL